MRNLIKLIWCCNVTVFYYKLGENLSSLTQQNKIKVIYNLERKTNNFCTNKKNKIIEEEDLLSLVTDHYICALC